MGISAFQHGASGWIRDPVLLPRIDQFAAASPAEGWEVFASLPLQAGFVVDLPDRGPCPREDDYCDPIVTAGQLSVGLRRRLPGGPIALSASLRAHTGAWNQGTRHRFDAVDYAETGLELGLAGAVRAARGPWRWSLEAEGGWDLVLKEDLGGIRAPLDHLRGQVRGGAARGRWSASLGLAGDRALGGIPYGESWVDAWYPEDVRWIVLRYAALLGTGKLSWNLDERTGLHLSATVTLAAWSGPSDLVDIGLGLHRWFPG